MDLRSHKKDPESVKESSVYTPWNESRNQECNVNLKIQTHLSKGFLNTKRVDLTVLLPLSCAHFFVWLNLIFGSLLII